MTYSEECVSKETSLSSRRWEKERRMIVGRRPSRVPNQRWKFFHPSWLLSSCLCTRRASHNIEPLFVLGSDNCFHGLCGGLCGGLGCASAEREEKKRILRRDGKKLEILGLHPPLFGPHPSGPHPSLTLPPTPLTTPGQQRDHPRQLNTL